MQIGAAIYHLLVLAAAIFDFCANGLLGGDLNLFAMVFENLVSISITMQNFKNWSQSARFSQIASPLQATAKEITSSCYRYRRTVRARTVTLSMLIVKLLFSFMTVALRHCVIKNNSSESD